MPLYAYGCAACGNEDDAFRTVEQRHDGPFCCGERMRLEIRPSYVQGDLQGYVSPVNGKWVEGRTARRDDLARTHSRPWEGMENEKREADRQRKYSEDKSEKRLDEAARRAYHQLSPAKRRTLE